MPAIALTLTLVPELDAAKLNVMINALKASLGPLGKDIKPIDANALNAELKKVEAEAQKAAAEFDKVAAASKRIKESASGFDKIFKFNQITQGVTTIAQSFQQVLTVGNEFEATLAAVGAVTGQSGEGLAKLGTAARELAKEFGTSASSNLKSFQGILSKFGPQVAENADALKLMGATVNTLSAASGDSADVSMAALTDTMLQLGLVTGDAAVDAQTMVKVADALAASAKVGAAEIPQVAASMLQTGVAAKGAKLSLEQTTAAIQVLAVGGKVGSEAGVALRNVLGFLQKQSGPGAAALRDMGTSVEELGEILTTQGLEAALTKLKVGLDGAGTTAEKNAIMMTLFGTENSAAAGILLDNLGQFQAFTTGIGDAVKAGTAGADGASAQANARLGTAEAIAGRLKAKIDDVFIGIQQTLGSGISGVITAASQIAPTLSSITQIKNLLPAGAIDQVKDYAVQLLSKFIPSVVASQAAVAASGATAGASAGGFSALWAAATGPVGLVVAAIALVVGGLYLMYQNVESFRGKVDGVLDFFVDLWDTVAPVIGDIGSLIGDLGALVFDFLIFPFELYVQIIGEAVGAFLGLIGVGGDGASAMDSVRAAMEGIGVVVSQIKAGLAGFSAAFGAVKDGITGSISALFSGDIAGAASAFLGMGEAAGDAFNEGANKSIRADVLKKRLEGMSDELKDSLTIQAKVDALDALPNLSQQLKELQTAAGAIELKVKAGIATAAEVKQLEDLKNRAEGVSAKIAEIAPKAVTSQKTVVDAAGNLKTVYEVSADAVAKLGEEQKKAFSGDLKKNAGDYSKSLMSTVAIYDAQKKELAEVKIAAEKAAAAGDTKKAEELAGKYKELKVEADKTGEQMEKAFLDGGKAGLVTDEAIKKVAASQGITSQEAKKRLIAKSLEDASKAGKLTDADIKKIADRFGYTVDEAKKLLAEQEKQTKEAKNTAASVDEISAAYDESFKKVQEDRAKGIKDLTSLDERISSLSKRDPERKRLIGEYQALKKKTDAANAEFQEETARQKRIASMYDQKEKKAKSFFAVEKESFSVEAERLENTQKRFEIDTETTALAAGRKKNTTDELLIAEKDLATARAKLTAAKAIGEVDASGKVTLNTKIKAEDQGDATKLLNDLYLSILEAQNKIGDVKLKATVEEIDLANAIRMDQIDALRTEVEAGLKPSSDLINEIQIELEKINAEYLTADAKKQLALQKQQVKYNEEIDKLKKKEYDAALKLIDEKAKAESEARKKELADATLQAQALIDASRAASEMDVTTRKDDALAELERQREEEIITEKAYNDAKKSAEEEYQKQLTAIRARESGQRMALQLSTDKRELEAQRKVLEEKLALAEKSGDAKGAQQLRDEMTALEETFKEKGDELGLAVGTLKNGLNDAINGLFDGNTDAMKESMRNVLGTIAGFLEKLASAAVIELVLASAPIKAIAAAAGFLAPVVLGGFSQLISLGIRGLLNPILSSILAFPTGGVFTSPQLAMVGDASRLGGSNVEYLLRNDQLKAVINEAIRQNESQIVAEIRALRSDLKNAESKLVLKGKDLYQSYERTKNSVLARERLLPA